MHVREKLLIRFSCLEKRTTSRKQLRFAPDPFGAGGEELPHFKFIHWPQKTGLSRAIFDSGCLL